MKEAGKWVFIVNPVAGNGNGLRQVGKIREMISRYDLAAEVVFTERRGHATELSEKFAGEGYRYIIAVGGDGTFNEIAAPLLFNHNVVAGAISGGSGNDTSRITGFSDQFTEEDWENFFRAEHTRIDIGKCNDQLFINGIGIGFDAEVAAKSQAESEGGKRLGKNKYIWNILKILLFFREKPMTVISDNGHNVSDCFINTVGNGRRFARSFYLTPGAVANDGLLDVCSISRLRLLQRVRMLMMVPAGKHVFHKKVNYYQTNKVTLEFPVEVPFHADGELFYAQRFEIGLISNALNIIYNPEGDHCIRAGGQG